MKCRLMLELEIPEPVSRKILRSITPDIEARFERRSVSHININKNILSLNISAADPTALRASFNSHMKLIGMCNQLSEEV